MKTKVLLGSSILALALVISLPSTSFAKGKDGGDNDHGNSNSHGKSGIVHTIHIDAGKNNKNKDEHFATSTQSTVVCVSPFNSLKNYGWLKHFGPFFHNRCTGTPGQNGNGHNGNTNDHNKKCDNDNDGDEDSNQNSQCNPTATSTLAINNIVTSAQITQAEISWTTNTPADSTVWFSTTNPVSTSASATPVVSQSNLVSNHFVILPNLTASTTYFVIVQSRDTHGNTATSSQFSFTTNAAPVINPLIISNVVATTASSSINISWTTNENADSELFYSTTTPLILGATSTQSVTTATLSTSHSLSATGLATSTTYYFFLQSKDVANNLQTVPQFSVTTTN